MKKIIVLLCVLFSLNASAFWCTAFDKALDVGTVVTASVLECERKDLIKLDYANLLHYDYFCDQPVTKGAFCGMLAQAMSNVLPQVVPDEWECKLDLAQRMTRLSIEFACSRMTTTRDHPLQKNIEN